MSKLSNKNPIKEIAEELDAFDTMLPSLVELLDEKSILTQQEWEKKIETKIEQGGKLLKYREVQFRS